MALCSLSCGGGGGLNGCREMRHVLCPVHVVVVVGLNGMFLLLVIACATLLLLHVFRFSSGLASHFSSDLVME
jgi:hypothetical protein